MLGSSLAEAKLVPSQVSMVQEQQGEGADWPGPSERRALAVAAAANCCPDDLASMRTLLFQVARSFLIGSRIQDLNADLQPDTLHEVAADLAVVVVPEEKEVPC